ncbi:MAG: hypothetical protein A2W08_01730 [Candidatus Rokubacteria bacterium RBG_16_73_20]|nr:MAG: hypothetical protein A2050_13140 [Candidatus Rokubacteria bacterium GWA2_73_35]OGK97664.1 MAG: hypothetical protein A2W08_01730 [Candidatus Rokubacteria bacterium RBG_16_73_20]
MGTYSIEIDMSLPVDVIIFTGKMIQDAYFIGMFGELMEAGLVGRVIHEGSRCEGYGELSCSRSPPIKPEAICGRQSECVFAHLY